MPPLHPIVIHFPIALFIIVVIFEGIILFTGKTNLNSATRILTVFSFFGVSAALITGDLLKNARASFLPGQLLVLHETLAIIFTTWMLMLLTLRLRKSWKPSGHYFALAVIGVFILTAVGDTGGEMVWPSASTTVSLKTNAITSNGPSIASTTSAQPSTTSNRPSNIKNPSSPPKVEQALFVQGGHFFVQDCQTCHSLAEPEQYIGSLTQSQWGQVVRVMQGYSHGAITDAQARAIVYFLSHQPNGRP